MKTLPALHVKNETWQISINHNNSFIKAPNCWDLKVKTIRSFTDTKLSDSLANRDFKKRRERRVFIHTTITTMDFNVFRKVVPGAPRMLFLSAFARTPEQKIPGTGLFFSVVLYFLLSYFKPNCTKNCAKHTLVGFMVLDIGRSLTILLLPIDSDNGKLL